MGIPTLACNSQNKMNTNREKAKNVHRLLPPRIQIITFHFYLFFYFSDNPIHLLHYNKERQGKWIKWTLNYVIIKRKTIARVDFHSSSLRFAWICLFNFSFIHFSFVLFEIVIDIKCHFCTSSSIEFHSTPFQIEWIEQGALSNGHKPIVYNLQCLHTKYRQNTD